MWRSGRNLIFVNWSEANDFLIFFQTIDFHSDNYENSINLKSKILNVKRNLLTYDADKSYCEKF